MRGAFVALIAAGLAAPSSAQPAAAGPEAATTDTSSNDVAALVESCSAHKFETVVRFTVDGKQHQSKVRLCGQAGQSDSQWAKTLRDAAKKLQANESMAPEARQQAIAAINAEILKLESGSAEFAMPATNLTLPRDTAKITGVAQGPPAGRLPEYSSLPPLPAPTATVAASAANAAAAVAGPPAPRMTIRCLLPSDNGAAGTCATMEKGTLLSVRADEKLPAGLRLRFLRKGNDRGEVTLAAMNAGQTIRVIPPARLCLGVVRSSAEIEIIAPGGTSAPVTRLGPYELVC